MIIATFNLKTSLILKRVFALRKKEASERAAVKTKCLYGFMAADQRATDFNTIINPKLAFTLSSPSLDQASPGVMNVKS